MKYLIIVLCILSQKAIAGESIFRPTGEYAKPVGSVNQATRVDIFEILPGGHSEAPVARKKSYAEYQQWYEIKNGVKYHTSDKHLIDDHGIDPEELKGLTQEEKNRLHGREHTEETVKAKKPVVSVPVVRSPCPGGVCPTPMYTQQQVFRRRR